MINKRTKVDIRKEMIELYNEGNIEFKNKIELELKNYPLIAIEKNNEVQINSLSSKGRLNPKHTYLGEFMINEYINYYISRDRKILDANKLMKEDFNIDKIRLRDFPIFDFKSKHIGFLFNQYYFINLNPENKYNGENRFLILDLDASSKSDSKKVYYYGRLDMWNGYMWNTSKKNYEYLEVNYYLEEQIKNFSEQDTNIKFSR